MSDDSGMRMGSVQDSESPLGRSLGRGGTSLLTFAMGVQSNAMGNVPVFLRTVLSAGMAERVDLISCGAALPSSCVKNLESAGGGGRVSEYKLALG